MPSTGGGRVGNLPFELTSFIGRRHELAEAKRLLTDFRLVTLTGVGGVGKTRVALRVAAQVRRAFDDGVWLVELGQVRDPALVAHTVAATLGLRDQSGRPPLAMLTEFLTTRRLLLVLDNCEHLVDAAAKLADLLLRSCATLRILATSREPLGIDGEATPPVPPLSVPDALRPGSLRELSRYDGVTLLAERATMMAPGFGITTHNQAAVAEICRRLDGLPLAIELAATWLRVLSPEQILDRLSDRYRLLSTGPRTAPARHQTLRSCIAWSYDLCTPAERLLWARSAVFAGGFELEAAEGICAGGDLATEELPDVAASLIGKSILIREERDKVVRYQLLETIREYGREKLRETGEYTALRRQHRDWYAQLARDAEADLISPRQVSWHARLDRENPNLRVALEFCLTEPGEAEAGLRMCVALHPYWTRGRLGEGRQWFDRALARHTGPPGTGRASALYAAAMLAGFQGDVPGATDFVTQARDLAEQLGDDWAGKLATQASANVAVFSGDLRHAVACYEAVLETHRARGDLPRLMEALIGLAFASGLLEDWPRVVSCHEEMLAITEPRGEVWYRSYALYDLGFAVWRQGDPRRAAGLLEQSLRLKRLVDDPLSTALCLEALAWIAAGERDHRRAATLLGATESLAQTVGTPTTTFPDLLAFHEECERQARRALGERAFQAAFGHGKDLGFADTFAYALREKPQTAAAPARTAATLTRREQEVADLIAEGRTNKEIAARLVISQRTAETHVENILTKLGLHSRTQIAAQVGRKPAG